MFGHLPDGKDGGGLENVAYVLVQHLAPEFDSMMASILDRHTSLKIAEANDGVEVRPGTVYVMRPGVQIEIAGGKFRTTPRGGEKANSKPIDLFFRSMAIESGPRGIAVVLSGSGNDGAAGVVDVHAAGGLVLAQAEITARFAGMPRATIATGLVDAVAEPSEIGDILEDYVGNPDRNRITTSRQVSPDAPSAVGQICRMLQTRYGLDIDSYKRATIARRMHRRMMLAGFRDMGNYSETLESDEGERDRLYHDLLIGVTDFFRDPESFGAFERRIFEKLSVWPDAPVRVWVCACATGQEAYTVAILLHRLLSDHAPQRLERARVFATDLDRRSIERASSASYTRSDVAGLPEKILRGYFRTVDDRYVVNPEIRRMIVFARHDALSDVPFTKLHAVVCRNLLIYLNNDAQRRCIETFQFSLLNEGLLFLGGSESLPSSETDFATLDRRHNIYVKSVNRASSSLPSFRGGTLSGIGIVPRLELPNRQAMAERQANQEMALTAAMYDRLLAEYMPPAVLIDKSGNVVETFGEASRFLAIPSGRLSTQLMQLAAEPIRNPLRLLLPQCQASDDWVRTEPLTLDLNGDRVRLELSAKRFTGEADRTRMLVCFRKVGLDPAGDDPRPAAEVDSLDDAAADRITSLERELSLARETLRSTIEQLETSNEELQATNEEMLASNEELQTTNEELHSVNEELHTVNAEYQYKIGELTEMTNDFDNLLACTSIPTIFLDADLNIRHFTPPTTSLFHFTTGDVGRPIFAFGHRLGEIRVKEMVGSVIAGGDPIEREVVDESGNDHLLRISPYRNDSRTTGAVITLVDITRIKQAGRQLERQRRDLDVICNSVPSLIAYLDQDLVYQYANENYRRVVRRDTDAIVGRQAREVLGAELFESLRPSLERALAGESVRLQRLIPARGKSDAFWADVTYTPDRTETSEELDWTGTGVPEAEVPEAEVPEAGGAEAGGAEAGGSEAGGDADSPPGVVGTLTVKVDGADRARSVNRPTDVGDDDESDVADQSVTPTSPRASVASGGTNEPSSNAIRNDRRTVRGLFVTIVDLTELKEAEARYARAAVGTGDGIYDWPIDGETFYGSQRFWDLIGRPDHPPTAPLEEYFEYIHPDDRQAVRDAVERHRNGATETFRAEYRLRMPDGSFRWIAGRGRIAGGPLGIRRMLTGSIRDIDAQKRYEFRLRDEVRNRDRFMAVLSHELRNPIGAIASANRLLRRAIENPDDSIRSTRWIESIEDQVTLTRRLLDDLLDASRLTHDKFGVVTVPIDLRRTIVAAVEMLRAKATKKKISLDFDPGESPLPVQGDADRLVQCFTNLINNAIRFTDGGGRIKVETEVDDETVEVRVNDSGVGLDARQVGDLFELFAQGQSPPRRRDGGGLGIGLALVRGIVEAHGGSVDVASDGRGRGTTFTVRLPVDGRPAVNGDGRRTDPVTVPNGGASVPAAPKGKERVVLLVDDLPAGREALATILDLEGYRVIQAETGNEAIEAFQEHRPPVCLIDIDLPDISGYRVAGDIRQMNGDDFASRPYLVAVTGMGQPQDQIRASDAGFDRQMNKPVDIDGLLDMLAKRFGG